MILLTTFNTKLYAMNCLVGFKQIHKNCVLEYICCSSPSHAMASAQGGRTWQAFGGGKNGHESFRQARIYNFRDKFVVFARNLKFSNLTQ